jgi:hypothetical protein
MFDNEPPELLFSINHGAKYTSNSTVELNLESYDSGSGIDRIAFSFDNTTWQPPGEFLETQVLTLPPADGEKTVYARITDKANNTCSPFAKKIVLDTEPPECSVMINDNATYTNSKDISLNITGLDMLSGVSEMSFSVDMEEWSPWQLFDFTKTYILSGDDGIKIVYLRVRDGAGNIAVAWDTIVLDTTPPHSLMISANNGAPETKFIEIDLTLSAVDYLSGVELMTIFTHLYPSETWEEFNETITYDLPPLNGPIVIYLKVKDRAGNIAEPVTAAIVLNTTTTDVDPIPLDDKPQPDFFYIYIMILVIIIVIILTLVAIISKRRKKAKLGEEHRKEQERVKGELVDITPKSPELPAPMSAAVAQVSPPQTVLQLPVAAVVSTTDGQQPHDILPSMTEPIPRLPPAMQQQLHQTQQPTPPPAQPNQTVPVTAPGITPEQQKAREDTDDGESEG